MLHACVQKFDVMSKNQNFLELNTPKLNRQFGPPLRLGHAPPLLVDIIRTIPELSRDYFRSRSRRALFGGISLLGGFYVAQTISLSFGALGVNDVLAAVVCVLLTEYVTKFYYSRPEVTFPIALLNNFKMGFTYGLFIDAFKLAS